jgi:uncharacterized protein (DUF4415 family)
MAAPGEKKRRRQSESRGRVASARPAAADSMADSASIAEEALSSEIRLPGRPPFSSATRLRIQGLTVFAGGTVPEKQKVSITLDKPLVDEIRAQFGGRALSTSINELLYAALAQERLGELVDEMEQHAGPASPEAYERVLAQWFAEG